MVIPEAPLEFCVNKRSLVNEIVFAVLYEINPVPLSASPKVIELA